MNASRPSRSFAAFAGALLLGTVFGCQEVEQQTTVLTPQQWKEVKAHILEEAPEPEYRINAVFGEQIELLGVSISDDLKAGQPATFTWYWRALEDIDTNWKIFVHFDSRAEAYRQGLDHHPVDGLYQTSRWKKGQIIEDIHEVVLNADYPGGAAIPYVGLFKGNQRMKITNADQTRVTDDRRVVGPEVEIQSAATAAGRSPTGRHVVRIVSAQTADQMTIDGKLDEGIWKEQPAIALKPYSAAPDLGTRVKVIATPEYLYVGGHMPDEHVWGTVEGRDGKTWEQEVLEIFIDHDRDQKDYLELQFAPNGAIFDARFPVLLGRGEGSTAQQIKAASAWNMEGLESAVHVEGSLNDDSDRDEFWSVEVKIPFSQIPGAQGPPKPGETWATNFYRYDRPDDNRTFAYGWETVSGSFHQSDKFAALRFTSAAASEVAKPVGIPKPVIKLDEDTRRRIQEQLQNRRNKIVPTAPPQGN